MQLTTFILMVTLVAWLVMQPAQYVVYPCQAMLAWQHLFELAWPPPLKWIKNKQKRLLAFVWLGVIHYIDIWTNSRKVKTNWIVLGFCRFLGLGCELGQASKMRYTRLRKARLYKRLSSEVLKLIHLAKRQPSPRCLVSLNPQRILVEIRKALDG